VSVVLNFAFVLYDLTVDFVGKQVDCGVQILVGSFAMNVFAA
jgi:hypothetical protein